MVIVKANPKQRRATVAAESDFSYLQAHFLFAWLMAANHTLFEKDRVFGFHISTHHLKQVITECMISTFKHWQLHIFTYIPRVALPVGRGFNLS